MAVKTVDVPDIGIVKLTKRRGAKHLRLRLASNGDIVVSMPTWVPYSAGRAFVTRQKDWIAQHVKPKNLFRDGQSIGRTHRLVFIKSDVSRPTAVIDEGLISIRIPLSSFDTSELAQAAAMRGVKKALSGEGYFLTNRLEQLAAETGLEYKNHRLRFMKSRWGSCSSQKIITLNYGLLEMPENLVDYVIIHELAHTKNMNHSADFWKLVEECMPDFKARRKVLKKAALTW